MLPIDKKTLHNLLVGDFSLKRLLGSALFIYACVCAYAYFFSERLIFQPQAASYSDTSDIIKLSSGEEGVQISALYLPNPKATYTILFSHGNAEDLGDIRWLLEKLRQEGFSVFAYDYRGYGTSQGTPSEQNTYRDIDAAYHYLTKKQGISGNRIIVYGRSVGSGPSVDLASRLPVAGLVLESAFVTAFRVLTLVPLFPFDKFANIDKIKHVRCPILIIHGTADMVIGFWHGEKLFAAAREPKRYFWVEGAGHNDVFEVAGDRYFQVLREFVQLVNKHS
ncbi:MAG: alpha/beta hydrolase [Oscillatoriaceae bacterium SKYG93]|nr:alpha/beta hydrolase [Oscillatoriaceae bacterium SKYG93]MDW8452872.1 alpha/beta hydrolase [Oscillatoriaceae cyanobacterium SKYGB_i_bin93]